MSSADAPTEYAVYPPPVNAGAAVNGMAAYNALCAEAERDANGQLQDAVRVLHHHSPASSVSHTTVVVRCASADPGETGRAPIAASEGT